MKERPILFSGPMVRALLDGRKTQTRRSFKVTTPDGRRAPITSPAEEIVRFDDGTFHYFSTGGMSGPYPCPYGTVGDRLWVRETFRECPQDQDGNCIEYRADRPEYRKRDDDPSAIAWTPSIHMPRWASRINLEVTGVRVERLQDIREDDAKAEGCAPVTHDDGTVDCGTRKAVFQQLWAKINGADSWAANPWVWVVEFNRVTA